MKRTAFDERRDVQIANDYGQSHLPCTFCSASTEIEALNTYGARCFTCYSAYCHQNRHYPSLSKQQRVDMGGRAKSAIAGGLRMGPRENMAYLSARESLTAGQRGFLQAARQPLVGADE